MSRVMWCFLFVLGCLHAPVFAQSQGTVYYQPSHHDEMSSSMACCSECAEGKPCTCGSPCQGGCVQPKSQNVHSNSCSCGCGCQAFCQCGCAQGAPCHCKPKRGK